MNCEYTTQYEGIDKQNAKAYVQQRLKQIGRKVLSLKARVDLRRPPFF
ncbi:hypothetical protein P700755_002984 [Psychroflexus torquis ATCC 700755]|uniref:Uncharacterized protein n=1 Tax=Psychroflexus torquis (strain ATCC 700755 / CIP 106069 / ACAM 623) TaxID=313595 RepID=K4IKQ8_PSYTT|nr:hypothetical protein P700755_002984 [Psychroflexus torquis ATCC 700755]